MTYGTDVEYAAQIEQKARMVRDDQGRQVVSSTTVYLATTTEIKPDARVTLPSGFTPRSPKIVTVERPSDEAGVSHTVLRLQ